MPQLADACAAGDVAAVRRLLAVGNRSKNVKSTLLVKDGKAAAEAPAESVPLMVKLITAGAKVPECRATIEMKPMVTAAPVDAA